MMPVIRINDGTFSDLKSISTWFGTRTPSETIDKLVKQAMEELGMERDEEPEDVLNVTSDGAVEFASAPGLLFTKPLKASVSGRNVPNPRWAKLLATMIAHIKAQGLDSNALVEELRIPAKVGRYEDEGFKFLPKLGISIQGQSAPDAWKEVERLASKWRIPVVVEFWWRQNEKAQFPGKTGILKAGAAK